MEQFKITEEMLEGRGALSLPDQPSAEQMTAQEIKTRLDAIVREVLLPQFNAAMKSLQSTNGAGYIGAKPQGALTQNTIGKQLLELDTALAQKADTAHTHTQYAAAEHTHAQYAAAEHAHSALTALQITQPLAQNTLGVVNVYISQDGTPPANAPDGTLCLTLA